MCVCVDFSSHTLYETSMHISLLETVCSHLTYLTYEHLRKWLRVQALSTNGCILIMYWPSTHWQIKTPLFPSVFSLIFFFYNIPSIDINPKCSLYPELGNSEFRSQEFHSAFQYLWKGTSRELDPKWNSVVFTWWQYGLLVLHVVTLWSISEWQPNQS